jgi:integrase
MTRVVIKLTPTAKGGWTARKRVPADVRGDYERLYGKRAEDRFNSGPVPIELAKSKAREWHSVVETRIANIRATQRGAGRTLTPKEAEGLCGQWYDWFLARQGVKHWPAAVWADQASDVHDALSDAIREASGEPWADHTDPYSVWHENAAARERARPIVADHAECEQFLHAKALALEPASRGMFLDHLIPSFFAAMRLLARNAGGDYSPDKWAERFPKFESAGDPGLTPWALFERWNAETKPAVSTVDRWRGVFLKLQADFPEHSAAALTPEEARRWTKGLVNAQRTEITVRDVWLVACRRVFGWAVDNQLLGQNPFKDVPLPVVRKTSNREVGKVLTADEIKTVLTAALAIGQPKTKMEAAKRWIPWLLAYTGARSGELTQLRGADVTVRDGIPAIKISPEAGTVKTKQARIVPLHEHLVEQGFLEFVRASGKGPLFYTEPSAPPKESDPTNPSRPRPVTTRVHLAEWVREIGVTDPEVQPLHAWRHTFMRMARKHRIDHDGTTINSICGWAQKSVADGYGPAPLQDMADALKRFPRYEVTTGEAAK